MSLVPILKKVHLVCQNVIYWTTILVDKPANLFVKESCMDVNKQSDILRILPMSYSRTVYLYCVILNCWVRLVLSQYLIGRYEDLCCPDNTYSVFVGKHFLLNSHGFFINNYFYADF